MELRVQTAEFLTTAMEPAGWPKVDAPEFAFVGRSNVGKSSLINSLCQRRKLVRVSNTPGRTKALNFFRVEIGDAKKPREVIFCDLPGYGFAKTSKAERASWKDLIEGYLTGREGLRAAVLLIDGEVGPTESDAETLAWLMTTQRPVVVVATKIDRLNKARRVPALQAHEAALRLPPRTLLGISSTEGIGLTELWWRLLDLGASRG